MQTRREYLVEKGLATPGRGRLSAAAHAAIDEAVANGMRFKDHNIGTTEKPVKSSETARVTENFTGPTAPKRFNGGWYILRNNKRVVIAGTEVCRTCKHSLDWHFCDNPVGIDGVGNLVPVMR